MDKDKLKETLNRQDLPRDPVMVVLQGSVARLDVALDLLSDFNQDLEGAASPVLSAWIAESQEFLNVQEQAGIFTALVLKIQAPLASNDPNPGYLVYDEKRLINEIMTMDAHVTAWLAGAPKVYVKARLWCDGVLQLVEPT